MSGIAPAWTLRGAAVHIHSGTSTHELQRGSAATTPTLTKVPMDAKPVPGLGHAWNSSIPWRVSQNRVGFGEFARTTIHDSPDREWLPDWFLSARFSRFVTGHLRRRSRRGERN